MHNTDWPNPESIQGKIFYSVFNTRKENPKAVLVTMLWELSGKSLETAINVCKSQGWYLENNSESVTIYFERGC
jgi:hypothetical protein